MKEDIFIHILELGQKANGQPISQHDIGTMCLRQNFFNQLEFDQLEPVFLGQSNIPGDQNSQLYCKYIFIYHILSDNFVFVHGNDKKLVLKTEGYFKLIEFHELKLARKNSESARTQSMIAVGLSILSLIAAVVLGVIQLNQDITIDNNQIHLVTDSIQKEFQRQDSVLNKIQKSIAAGRIDSLSFDLDSTGRNGSIYR
jgi:hypothetical protein